MRRRFSSHMAMLAQHGGSWSFMVDLPYLEHDKVGRMWHVHFTMAVHTVVALHPDWIPFQLFVCVKKMKQIMQNLHISLETSKMLVWRPTIHWKQIPCRPSEKKHPLSGSACQTVCNRIHLCSACPRTSWELWRKIMQRSDGWSHCHPAIFADFAVYPVIFRRLCDQTRTSLPSLPHDIS